MNSRRILSISALLALPVALGCSADSSSCTVKEVENGALIVCDDGTSTLIQDGPNGRNGEDGQDGEDGSAATSCATPATTFYLDQYTELAEEGFDSIKNQREELYEGCPENGVLDTDPAETCREWYLAHIYWTYIQYAERINFHPNSECGAKIFERSRTVDEFVANDNEKGYPLRRVNDVDTDGDGINNHAEWFMGLNPCHQKSNGCTNDGDDDFDADGIINAEDPRPYCQETAEYQPAECI